jgi:hypothetical protein
MWTKMIVVAAVGLTAAAAQAAGTPGPGAVADFAVTVRGSYNLQWAMNQTGDCGIGTETAFLDGRSSQTIRYRTPRPVRVHTLWKTLTYHGKRYPWLVLEDRWHGFKTSTDPRRSNIKFQIDVPAVFTRTVSGTYALCGGSRSTVSQAGCGNRSVPQFVVALAQEIAAHRIGYQALTRFGDPYRGTCAFPDMEGAVKQDPPLMVTDLSGSLACPSTARFFAAAIGRTLTCKEIPPKDYTIGGTQKQTQTVAFRRIR